MADSKNLPINSYLVKYNFCDKIFYDIVQSHSKTKIFDSYYDKFGKGAILSISWTDGRVNPRLYGATKPDTEKRTRR